MTNGINRNGSGYYDETAYMAIKNYIKSEEKNMELYEGDIFRAVMKSGEEREFVILSVHKDISTVLMLSDNEYFPCEVNCNGIKYTHPGMLQYVFNDRFTTFIRSMKKDEIDDLKRKVLEALGCSIPEKETPAEVIEKVVEKVVEVPAVDEELKNSLDRTIAERDIYKELYEKLLMRMMPAEMK